MIAGKIQGLDELTKDEKVILAAELWKEANSSQGDKPDPVIVYALRECLAYNSKE